jgi:outer membrane protein assembly factor BamB
MLTMPLHSDSLRRPILFVLDVLTGAELVRRPLGVPGSVESCHLAPAGDRLVVSAPGELSCFDATSGKRIWSLPREEPVAYYPELHVSGSRVLATERKRRVLGIDLKTGRILWKGDPAGPVGALSCFLRKTICTGDRIIAAFEADGGRASEYSAVAWRLDDGKKLWQTRLEVDVRLDHTNPIPVAGVAGGRLFLAQNRTRNNGVMLPPSLIAIDVETGRVLRRVGVGRRGGYNNRIYGGKITRTVIGVITATEYFGFSATGRIPDQ